MRLVFLLIFASFAFESTLPGQDDEGAKQRAKEARELGRGGSETLPRLIPFLSDPVPDVRCEAVKSIVGIGTQHSIDPLIQASKDTDAEVQFRAVDGIVNFYLPGYVPASRFGRASAALRNQFDRENTQVIDPSVSVPQNVAVAIGKVVSGGVSLEARINAARAAGVLRARPSVPDLLEALRSKNSALIYESLIALQKIGDTTAGPRLSFLLRDFEEGVQIAAIETTGLLQNREAIPDLRKVYATAKTDRVRKASLAALSMLPDETSRPAFEAALSHKNDGVRAAAVEGIARLQKPSGKPSLDKAFNEESKMPPRLAAAFGLVLLGDVSTEAMSPLTYLTNTLNSKAYRQVAEAYLVEAARQQPVRTALHRYLPSASPPEKISLGRVLAVSGTADSVPFLEALSRDANTEVAQEGVRSLRNLRSRLP